MPIFSRKNQPNKKTGAAPARKNQATLSCPVCGFEQSESVIAVSTYCRSCNSHYQISNGKAVPKNTRPSNPFTSLPPSTHGPKLRGTSGHEQTQAQQPAKPVPSQPMPPSGNGQKTKAATREVKCFDCDKTHQAPAEASSTLCPACGAYIGLKDYDIRDNWNRRIQTRGNVTIHKKATVTGITIHCHHLGVQGTLTGGVDCSGDFTIQNHGKIMGKVRCKRLIIEKKARVEFANPVHCEDAIIDGTVTGNLTCSGKLHLKKKATLNGDIQVSTMTVDEGARHQGRISIGQH